jgi:hypothetical protein
MPWALSSLICKVSGALFSPSPISGFSESFQRQMGYNHSVLLTDWPRRVEPDQITKNYAAIANSKSLQNASFLYVLSPSLINVDNLKTT